MTMIRVLRLPQLIAVVWCLLGTHIVAAAPQEPAPNAARETVSARPEELDARVRSIVDRFEAKGFSGAVLVARDGKVVAECAAGSADLEGAIPNTPVTLFEIASLTKQFTAAAIMRLVQDGRLRLDDPISKHLPGVPENCHAITVEHLLRHTSGIPGSNSRGAGDDLAVVLPTFLAGGPRHEPGTHFEYWNQGYALLSEIVKRVSGRAYMDYCRAALFLPANMTTACFTGDAAPPGATVAVGRSRVGPPRSALEHPYGAYGFQYRGMGGTVCSVQDLFKWDRALAGDAVLNAESKAALFSPGPGNAALGWMVRRDAKGRQVQHHGGAVRGFTCDMRRFPEIDGMIAVLANDDGVRATAIADALERALLGDPPDPAESAQPLDRAGAERLIGTYRSEQGADIEIRIDEAGTVRFRVLMPPDHKEMRAGTVIMDASGQLFLKDEWTAYPLKVTPAAGDAAQTLSLGGPLFRRVVDAESPNAR